MATKPMKTLKLPGLEDTYTFLQNDTTLAVSGKAADAKATGDALAAVQTQVDGVQAGQYPDMGAGQLLSTTGTVNPTPYTYRENVSGSDRVTISQITGGTVAWNQLMREIPDRSADGVDATTTNGKVHIAGTPATANFYLIAGTAGIAAVEINWIKDHKYLITFGNANYTGSVSSIRWYIAQDTETSTGEINLYANSQIINMPASYKKHIQCRIAQSYTIDASYTPQVFDLTQMFGSAVADYIYGLETTTAGAGASLFRQMFPESYYPYNAGELVSVQTSGRKTVGFNLFDKSAATTGKVIYADGVVHDATISAISDYIRVLPNTQYYTNYSSISSRYPAFAYDSGKNLIGYMTRTSSSWVVTTPSGAAYVRLNIPLVELDSACFNFSDPTRNGTFEPYSAHTYPLDSTLTLRGIPVLTDGKVAYDGDQYAPDGTVTRRIRIVTLDGTTNALTSTYGVGATAIPAYKSTSYPVTGSDAFSPTCVLYSGGDRPAEDYIRISTANNVIALRVNGIAGYGDGTSYADAGELRAAANAYLAEHPVTVVYATTPSTETADTYQEIQVAGSTEEFLDAHATGPAIPVGSQSLYQTNLRAGLEKVLETLDGADPAHSEAIAPVQGDTASTNIASGELLMKDGKLYTATQAIVAGAEIGSTNTTETTLAAQLAALEARIAALEN